MVVALLRRPRLSEMQIPLLVCVLPLSSCRRNFLLDNLEKGSDGGGKLPVHDCEQG